ncbi:histidine kinase [Streptomyces sp. PmtG]
MSTSADGLAVGGYTEANGKVLPPRKAIAITAVVLVGFFVIDGAYVWAQNPPPWERVAVLLGFAAIMGLQLGFSFPRLFPFLTRFRYAAWGLQGLLAYLPIAEFGEAWGGMAAFLTASAVLVFPGEIGWSLFGLSAAGDSAVFYHFGFGWADNLYTTVEVVLIPLVVIGLSRMSGMIVQLHHSRAELARLAVAGERLRFARDLHGVLGSGLSAISLKCELAYRLIADAPAKAQDELTDVLRTSRKALADVRSVSRGYREMSLSGEADAAVSMLAAAGIHTQLRMDCGPLPGEVDTVLATLLREGLTNLLRHSKAEQCVIKADARAGSVVLSLANDGSARPARAANAGADGGLATLERRVAALGGSLTHGTGDDGWFRLVATVPVREAAGPERGPRPARPDAEETPSPMAPARRPCTRDLVPRAAAAITFAVLVGYFLAAAVAVSFGPGLPELVGVLACLLALLGLQLAESFHWRLPWAPLRTGALRYGMLGLQAVIQFVPFLLFGQRWMGIPGFFAGTVLLVLPAAVAWPALVAVIASVDAALYAVGIPLQDVVYESAYIAICALVVYGLSQMAQLASELHRSRAEIARLAVTTERLRFARDLHDLLGFSLSTVTLKCELVRRLAPVKPVRAQEELSEVLQIARQALADVRTVASGSHRMSLTSEAE